VDDEPELALALAKVLSRRGLEVEVRADGPSALAAAAAAPFDAALVDLRMPGMDGIRVLAALRARVPPIPVVLMTGQPSPADEERARDAGAAALVLKPHPVGDLAALLRAAAGRPG
jgi:CheY-like chemotaxis protein